MTLAELTRRVENLEKTVEKVGEYVANLRIWQGWTKGFWFGLGALTTFAAAGAAWKILQ